MSSTFGRARSTEAPMVGIEFTNRAKTIPAWRVGADNDQSGALKRTHSTANPSQPPFDPTSSDCGSRPLFGSNVRCLFSPPQPAQQPEMELPPATASSWNNWLPGSQATPVRPTTRTYALHKTPEAPEVDMKDIEVEMASPSGGAGNEESPERRVISNAAVRRIARKQAKLSRTNKSRATNNPRQGNAYVSDVSDDSGEEDSGFEDEKEEIGENGWGGLIKRSKSRKGVTQNLSNHYTLNMPVAMPMSASGVVDNGANGEGPYVLAGYLQFGFNFSLIVVFLYLLVQFIFTIQRDVAERIGEVSMEFAQESSTCATHYEQNLCGSTPIPAMLTQCAIWKTCMARDSRVVGRARIGAGVLAEVVNGFVDGISWKTLAFTLSSLAFLTIFVNALLSLYRSKHRHHQTPNSHQLQQQVGSTGPGVAPHLQSLPQGPFGLNPFSQMHPYGYMTQGPHVGSLGGWRPDTEGEVEQMPRQRRRLEGGVDEAVS